MRVARQRSGASRTSDRGISDLLRVEMQDGAAAGPSSWKKCVSTHFDEAVAAVPVCLEVFDGAGKFFLRDLGVRAVDDQASLALGDLEELTLAHEVRHAQAGHAGLLGSEEFAGATDFEIFLGDREAILGLDHGVEALFSFGCDFLAGHQDAARAGTAAPGTPPQRM